MNVINVKSNIYVSFALVSFDVKQGHWVSYITLRETIVRLISQICDCEASQVLSIYSRKYKYKFNCIWGCNKGQPTCTQQEATCTGKEQKYKGFNGSQGGGYSEWVGWNYTIEALKSLTIFKCKGIDTKQNKTTTSGIFLRHFSNFWFTNIPNFYQNQFDQNIKHF